MFLTNNEFQSIERAETDHFENALRFIYFLNIVLELSL